MSEDPANLIIRMGRQLEGEREIASDLWTWLPSYKEAKAKHGDYAHEHFPGAVAVMDEACDILAEFKRDEWEVADDHRTLSPAQLHYIKRDYEAAHAEWKEWRRYKGAAQLMEEVPQLLADIHHYRKVLKEILKRGKELAEAAHDGTD